MLKLVCERTNVVKMDSSRALQPGGGGAYPRGPRTSANLSAVLKCSARAFRGQIQTVGHYTPPAEDLGDQAWRSAMHQCGGVVANRISLLE
jgi:hypothetical protein